MALLKSKGKNKRKKFKKNKKRKGGKILFFILSLFFLGVSFWVLFFSSLTKIKNIKASSFYCQKTEKKFFENKVSQYLEGKYFRIFSKNNVIILSKKNLKSFLKEQEKLIKDIQINKKFPQSMEINIVCQEKYFIWHQPSGYYLVNEEGRIFAELSESELSDYRKNSIEVVSENSKLAPEEFIFDEKKANFFIELGEKPELDLGLDFKEKAEIPVLAVDEITVETKKGWKILFNTKESLNKQLKIIKKLLEENLKEENLTNLEYIDLRIPGKAIYKMRNIEIKEDKEATEAGKKDEDFNEEEDDGESKKNNGEEEHKEEDKEN